MSRYTDIIRAFCAQRVAFFDGTAPLNMIVAARLADALVPGELRATNGFFSFGGARLTDVKELASHLAIPGARVRSMQAPADLSFIVDCSSPPAVLLTDFTAADLGKFIGASNLDFLASLRSLWDVNVRRSMIFAGYQIDRAVLAVSIGAIVYPESPVVLANLFPSLPSDLTHPTFANDDVARAYDALVLMVKPIMTDYANRNLAVAASELQKATQRAEFWDSFYAVTEAVRDLPFTAAEYGAKGLVLGLGSKNLVLLGVVGAVVAAWFLLPKIAAVKSIMKGSA